MPQKQLQPRRDQLVDQYRDIGPAALVAALMSTPRPNGEARNDNRHNNSILAKKPA